MLSEIFYLKAEENRSARFSHETLKAAPDYEIVNEPFIVPSRELTLVRFGVVSGCSAWDSNEFIAHILAALAADGSQCALF
jgi:hypothetical protein